MNSGRDWNERQGDPSGERPRGLGVAFRPFGRRGAVAAVIDLREHAKETGGLLRGGKMRKVAEAYAPEIGDALVPFLRE